MTTIAWGELAPLLEEYREAGYTIRRRPNDPATEAESYEVRDPFTGVLYTTVYLHVCGRVSRDPYQDTRTPPDAFEDLVSRHYAAYSPDWPTRV